MKCLPAAMIFIERRYSASECVSFPAIGHRIFGIDHQIHDHLFDLPGIGPGVRRLGRQLGGRTPMFSPINGRSRRSMSCTIALTSTTFSSSNCLRLKASNCRVRVVARSAAC